MKFPDPCQEIMSALSPLNFELFKFVPIECIVKVKTDYFLDLLFSTLLPIAFSRCLLAAALAAKARAKSRGGASAKETTNFLFSIFLFVTFLTLPSCSKKIFATFKCNEYVSCYEGEQETIERYLALDLSVSCGYPSTTTYYQTMSLYAGLMVLIYPLGIPALYSVLLFRARGELSIPELRLSKETRSKSFYAHFFGYHATHAPPEKTPEQEEWEKVAEKHYLSFLIQPYEQRVYWFEVVEVLRRLSLSGALIVSPTAPQPRMPNAAPSQPIPHPHPMRRATALRSRVRPAGRGRMRHLSHLDQDLRLLPGVLRRRRRRAGRVGAVPALQHLSRRAASSLR